MPSIADGEYFPLYPARLRGVACDQDLTPEAWLWPSNLEKTIEYLRDFVGPVNKVVAKHSLLPLFSRCLSEKDRTTLHGHFLGKTQMGLPAIVGSNGPRSGWARAVLARCPKCIQEIVAPDGSPYWMREHLVPGLWFCAKHQIPLHVPCEWCVDFDGNPSLTTHPGMHCGCGLRALPGTETLSDTDGASEVELARVAGKLLDPDYLPHLSHDGVAAVVPQAAESHGLLANGVINWSRVETFFNDSRHRHILTRTTFPVECSKSFRLVLKGKRVLRHPLHNVVLLNVLFGAWPAVEDAFSRLTGQGRVPVNSIKWKVDGPKPQAQKPRERWIEKNHVRWFATYAEQYRETRKINPEETHTQLMRRLPIDATRFISRKSLAAAGEDVSYFGSGNKYYEILDKSFSNHINVTKKKLIESDYPSRLTTRVLLRGHRMDRGWEQIRDRLPMASQALVECKESRSAYQKRRLFMLSRNSPFQSVSGLTKEQIDNLGDETVVRLLKQGAK